jgi:hypothetical protein
LQAACRVDQEELTGSILKIRATGIGCTEAVVVIAGGRTPSRVVVAGKTLDTSQYDVEAGILRLRFVNTAEPALVKSDSSKRYLRSCASRSRM